MNNQSKLLTLAKQAADNAYAPYSKLKVGAAILSSDNKFYSGCNVENKSFPVGTCAEESAIAALICAGGHIIAEILIYADSKQLISPCGACRQRIAEFSDAATQIHLANACGIQKTLTVNDALPFAFKEF